MRYTFKKVDLKAALDIVGWEYPAPYKLYNLYGSLLALDRLVEGSYFSVFVDEALVGFFCYGSAAQPMYMKGHELYQAPHYLDIGLGLRPSWCGGGFGVQFVRAGLVFAREQNWSKGFRLTVAADNIRAFKTYTRLGFQEVGRIVCAEEDRADFVVMTLDTFGPILPNDPAD